MNTFSELHMSENTDSEHLFSVSIHLHGTITFSITGGKKQSEERAALFAARVDAKAKSSIHQRQV